MGVRRDGREAAVQFLYQCDLGGDPGSKELEGFYRLRGLSPSARRFCDAIIKGCQTHGASIDEAIRTQTQNYEFGRISAVDRNILRVSVYELLHCPDIPPVVSINEAIEIAKKYSTEESGKFVNGVLDNIRARLTRPARTATKD